MSHLVTAKSAKAAKLGQNQRKEHLTIKRTEFEQENQRGEKTMQRIVDLQQFSQEAEDFKVSNTHAQKQYISLCPLS